MAELWEQFARVALPPDAPEVQRREMKRAFYSGAHGIMFKVIHALAPGQESTEADEQLIQDLHEELQEFAELIKQGRA
jgi:hypothetical protein